MDITSSKILNIHLNIQGRFLYLFIALVSFFFEATGQYRVPRSSVFFAKGLVNPGNYGLSNSVDFVGAYRDQWTRIQGAPKGQHLDVSVPFSFLKGGLGFTLENLEVGAYRDLFVGMAYAYHLELGGFSRLGIGVRGGMRQAGLNGRILVTPEGNYTSGIFHNDDILAVGDLQSWLPSVDVGVSYQGAYLSMGAGLWNSLGQRAGVLQAGEAFGNQQLYAHASYEVALPYEIKLKPFLLFWTDFVENQINLQAISTYREKISLIVGLRGFNQNTLDAFQIGGIFQFNEKMAIGYIFDSNLHETNTIAPESHEVFITYSLLSNIGKGKLPPIKNNPRYF